MKIQELSNKEIVFAHMYFDDMLYEYDQHIEKGGLSFVVDSPFGPLTLFKEFTPEEKELFENSPKIALLRSITNKLEPIVTLIGESDPDLVQEVKDLLYPETEEADEDQDEDM